MTPAPASKQIALEDSVVHSPSHYKRTGSIQPNTSRPALIITRQPLSLADRIARLGRALKADELAELLNVSKVKIFKGARAGKIPTFRIGTAVRFDPKTVSEWLRMIRACGRAS